MPALLTLITEDGTELAVRVVHSITIGRAAGNALRVGDRNVSRFHALIARLDDGTYLLRDGGSSNGTYVNGVPVVQRTLNDADQLRIGDLDVRFALVPALPGDDALMSTVDPVELDAAQARVAALLEQVADLRSAVSEAQYEEDQACKERDGVLEELRAAKAELEKLRAADEALEARAARLAEEVRGAQAQASAAGDTAPLERQLGEARKQVEALQLQVAQMRESEARAVEPRKEVARLTEELNQTRERLAATTEVLKTAMARVGALTEEVSRLRAK